MYWPATVWTIVLEQVRMLQGAADEGTQPDGVGSYFGHPAATVGHFQVKRDEIELVNVFPVVEAGIDFNGVTTREYRTEGGADIKKEKSPA